jgi:hypothetical protein
MTPHDSVPNDFFHDPPPAVEHAVDELLAPRETKLYPSRRKSAAGWLARLADWLDDVSERARQREIDHALERVSNPRELSQRIHRAQQPRGALAA